MAVARKKDRSAESQIEKAVAAVAKFIKALKAPAAVIGGIAVSAQGVPRTTADVDVAVAADPRTARAVLKTARAAGLEPRVPDAIKFAEENLVLLLEHVSTGVPVDVSFALQQFEQEALRCADDRRYGKRTTDEARIERVLAEFDAVLDRDMVGDYRRIAVRLRR